ncbi:flagellar hook-associated protein FlgL [Microbulbifer thermotolerans]|uniref:flagellar hook-associated protein FlgL n=1 Tax=Microbulbifer thermotolerans TaxID=252514 RepID=UPI00224B7B58|nr:flagellar hook-associated protein FlgL [Microbulbifer thermotolerans]MCX2780111.1 flagellar hook-associated protein FlgL [Microbulbifer thermotolerans]MCX2805535.1 flagellar hook-associated protein FlgL [Microbulbifer thermotolerans]
MRISTVTVYEQSMSSMNRQQGDFLKVGQQIASGRRVVNPSDDPQAASQAVQVSQSLAITEQYTDARVSARNALSQEESILNSVSDAIASAKTLIIQAASDTLSDADRASVASELRGIYETVIGQANATDGNGRYLFGGYQDDSAPFVRSGTGSVVYVADNNSREVRIDASRLMPVADNGIEVFQSVPAGAGYVAEADSANTGSVTFKGPNVVDETDPGYGGAFDITFSVASGTATYSINGGAPQAYVSGQAISFGGLTMTLDGDPADGDRITVDLAQNMNTDLFATFEKALATLEQPASSDAEKAARANTLSTVMREFDNSLDNVLTVRASVGARLNELDVVDSVAANRTLNYEQALSDLVDLDYVEAIAEYSLRQVGLQAAQQAFVDIKSLSLFDRL